MVGSLSPIIGKCTTNQLTTFHYRLQLSTTVSTWVSAWYSINMRWFACWLASSVCWWKLAAASQQKVPQWWSETVVGALLAVEGCPSVPTLSVSEIHDCRWVRLLLTAASKTTHAADVNTHYTRRKYCNRRKLHISSQQAQLCKHWLYITNMTTFTSQQLQSHIGMFWNTCGMLTLQY